MSSPSTCQRRPCPWGIGEGSGTNGFTGLQAGTAPASPSSQRPTTRWRKPTPEITPQRIAKASSPKMAGRALHLEGEVCSLTFQPKTTSQDGRSEERRVGKECVSRWKLRWAADQKKKKK